MESEVVKQIALAYETVLKGIKRIDTETETHIVKAYWVVDIIRIDIQEKK